MSLLEKLDTELRNEIPAILQSKEVTRAVELAFGQMTEIEHKILVMQFRVGMSLEDIAAALGLKSRQAAEARVRSVLKIFKLYLAYFAGCDHEYVDAHLESFVGMAAGPMRVVFDGKRSGRRLSNSYRKITDDNIAGFIQLVSKLSRYNRT